MRRKQLVAALVIFLAPALGACRRKTGPVQVGDSHVFTFEGDTSGQPPAGWTFASTGAGRPGRWIVTSGQGAPSGENALAQTDADPVKDRYLLAIAGGPGRNMDKGDVSVSVRAKIVSGGRDQAFGVVFHYRNEKEYLVARADGIDNNIRLYAFKNGTRGRLAEAPRRISHDEWHELRVDVKGTRVVATFDGIPALDVRDAAVPAPGKNGVWTKSDSGVLFDDLTVGPSGI